MIKQCAVTDIRSRSECNVFDNTGFLPIVVSPMYSCVDRTNAHVFLENKIKVCMPRKEYMDASYEHCSDENYFDSYSLEDFVENFINTTDGFLTNKENNIIKTSVCIDTATGHLKALHEAIRKAKEIHGDNLVIMAGNVSSVEAFIELAKTGCDYIRVGVGGGSGCNTSLQTGVGQENLEELIRECSITTRVWRQYQTVQGWSNVVKVKIVADGISRFVDQLVDKKEGLDNGYAAINRLLYAGADLVMIGKLFAQCFESAGEKTYNCGVGGSSWEYCCESLGIDKNNIDAKKQHVIDVKYQGMSTKEAQMRYKNLPVRVEGISRPWTAEDFGKKSEDFPEEVIKPSEGKTSWIPVKWTLNDWLNGREREGDYLPGWANSIRSAMSYTGSRTLKEFKQ